MNKFSITNTISQNPNISYPPGPPELIKATDGANNGWKSFPYLKEKVYISVMNLTNIHTECLSAYDNRMQLYLADDLMYKYSIFYEYRKEDYQMMIDDYQKFIDLHLSLYPYYNLYDESSTKTEEKTGEGYKFFMEPEELRDKDKINELSIGYSIVYKLGSNEVDHYEIKISKVDLNGTKLKSEMY